MNILIIGAGALGGLFAALLAPHAHVRLFTTNTDHAEAIKCGGLRLIRADGSEQQQGIEVLTELLRDAPRSDLILICTKSQASEAAAYTARNFLAADGLVLSLQNGLGNLARIQKIVGAEQATVGITAQGATLLAPGQVRHAGSGPTVIGATTNQVERVTRIASLFKQAGISTSISDDLDALLWSKLLVNVGINALVALLRVPNGALVSVPECEPLMVAAVTEALAVAKALGIRLPAGDQVAHVRQVCADTASNRASMLQDILRGKATEIDAINGAVVAKGRECGVPTPVNLCLTHLIKATEATVLHRIFSLPDA